MGISQTEFERIVYSIAEEPTSTVDSVDIRGSVLIVHWTSYRGNRHSKRYDFNDDGEISGRMVTIGFPPPPAGATAPDIFVNKVAAAIRRSLKS